MRSTILFVALALGWAACAPPSASADSITYNSGSLPINPPFAISNGTVAATLPQFDPTLGQLTSADFAIDWDLLTTGDAATFNVNGVGSVTITVNGHFTLTSPDATPLVDASALSQQTVGFIGFGNTVLASNTGSGVGSLLATDAEVAPFLGSGTITLPLNFNADTTYDYTNGSGGFINLTGLTSASVTYNFSPTSVPEPGSIALLAGMGLFSVGFLARRRKQARKAA